MAPFLNLDFIKAAEDLWVKGGWVIYPLYVLGLVGWILVCLKFIELWFWSRDLRRYQKQRGQLLQGQTLFAKCTNLLISKREANGHAPYFQYETEIQIDNSSNRHLETIGRIAAVSPLVGLLGTVAGLIATFEVLHLNTLVNATQLSAGVSEALVATQAGLLTAFPLMLAHQHICSWADRLGQWSKAEWTYLRKTTSTEENNELES